MLYHPTDRNIQLIKHNRSHKGIKLHASGLPHFFCDPCVTPVRYGLCR